MLRIKQALPLVLLLACLVAAGCGGGGHSGQSGGPIAEVTDPFVRPVIPTPTPPGPGENGATVLQGHVVKGVVRNAVVDLHKINAKQIEEQVFKTTLTDADGHFSFDLESSDTGPFYLRVSIVQKNGGASETSMICDIKPDCGDSVFFASDVALTADFTLGAVVAAVIPHQSNYVGMTAITDLTAEYAIAKDFLNTQGIADANSYVAELFGLAENFSELPAVDISADNAVSELDDEARKNLLISAGVLGAAFDYRRAKHNSSGIFALDIGEAMQGMREDFVANDGQFAQTLEQKGEIRVYDILNKAMYIGRNIDSGVPFRTTILAIEIIRNKVDTDLDNVPDYRDVFPYDSNHWADSDGDGVSDRTDAFPNDPFETIDSDGDGVGDNSDAFPMNPFKTLDTDRDGHSDLADAFPLDPTEWKDNDRDGVGNNLDAFPNTYSEWQDTDGDGRGDRYADRFPDDPNEWDDWDFDGVGNNSDEFPRWTLESKDSDRDGVGDNADKFPDDPNESADWDRDGHGDNSDRFPKNYREWADTDGDGVGDNGDVFPGDRTEWKDSDRDGIGNNADRCPFDRTNKCQGAPTAQGFTINVVEGSATEIHLLASDANEEDVLIYTVFADPEFGELSSAHLPNSVRMYVPQEGCGFTDNFAYNVSDGKDDSLHAVVFINVLCNGAVTMPVAAGDAHSCQVVVDGKGNHVECWGHLGAGKSTPPVLTNPTAVAAGQEHSCAVAFGDVECWGANNEGQIQAPYLLSATAISAGNNHNCAIHDLGVSCWGRNTEGQTLTPSISNPKAISAGANHNCSIGDNGVRCWGDNSTGQIDVPALTNPTAIAAGSKHSCAIDGNAVVCWGDPNSPAVLTSPSLSNPRFISAGDDYTCVVDDSGLQCWGSDGNEALESVPVVENPTALDAGQYHACVESASGLSCWGRSSSNQLR